MSIAAKWIVPESPAIVVDFNPTTVSRRELSQNGQVVLSRSFLLLLSKYYYYQCPAALQPW
jgi:hypothetical protein